MAKYEAIRVYTSPEGHEVREKIVLYQADGIRFHASSKLVENEKQITSVTTWQTLGGVITNPSFFVQNLAAAFGRTTIGIKTTGSGAELRILEVDPSDGSEVVVSAVQALPDTAGAWQVYKFNTVVPSRAGDMEYRLEGRLNGATLAEVRFGSISLLEVLP